MSSYFVFVTGGVLSSLGKGLAASVIGGLLKKRGLNVCLRKLDPYLNIDPGTMSPYQHGEVYVTDDGCETDLDLGHYERFTGTRATRFDYITTGQIYQGVLERERQGDYHGATVQVIPHITQAIEEFVTSHVPGDTIVISEIGGTVGDIESLPFLESVRQMRQKYPDRVRVIHMGWVPYIHTAGEFKTKPMQHSVRELQRAGIQPDILLLRASGPLPEVTLEKVSLLCNVPKKSVRVALDQKSIYQVPLAYHQEGLDSVLLDSLGLSASQPDLKCWEELERRLKAERKPLTLGLVAKYGDFPESYKSLIEALMHAALQEGVALTYKWINPDEVEAKGVDSYVNLDGVLVPGGFGERGFSGTLRMITWARENGIPFLGICLGMQLTVIEAARNLLGLVQADSQEFSDTPDPVVHRLSSWEKEGKQHIYDADKGLGGTMRLGAYPCVLQAGSRVQAIYGCDQIAERHRHRFEVNTAYLERLEGVGLVFSGLSPCGQLPEVVERVDHPFFVAVQFHPEFLSNPLTPHPLFCSLMRAMMTECSAQKAAV